MSANNDIHKLSVQIKKDAVHFGFDACGIAQVKPMDFHIQKLKEWLDGNRNGDMGYMEKNINIRSNPSLLVENAKSVIVCLLNYYQPNWPPEAANYKISSYALGDDYHHIVKEKLKALLDEIKKHNPAIQARIFTDSAPVLERAWAVEAGLGWIGNNSSLIVPQKGSWFFIGEIITDIELEYDHAFEKDFCGSCRRCIESCPTKAILPDKTIDATRCISYLTIEAKSNIPEALRKSTCGWIFGCDICQMVCPWNRFAKPSTAFPPNPAIIGLDDNSLENLSREDFTNVFPKKKSAVARAGFDKLMDNISAAKKEMGGN